MSRKKIITLNNLADTDTRYLDKLTTVFNKKFFDDKLKKALNEEIAKSSPFAFLLIDIDDFENFNELNGYERGDQVLQQLGLLLNKNLRESDFCIRYEDDQFLVVLIESDKDNAYRVGERIRRIIEEHVFPGEQLQPGGEVTVSIGLASYPVDGESIAFLIKRADTALYRAKEKMKNRVEVFHF